jgi:hypothetical protein
MKDSDPMAKANQFPAQIQGVDLSTADAVRRKLMNHV